MKKSILILSLLLIILSTVVYSISANTTAKWVYRENATESANSTVEEVALHEVNYSIDGNWSTYTLANGTIYRNYTKLGDNYDSMASSLWKVKYNATGGTVTTTNHSIPSVCWNYSVTKLIFKINMTYNGTNGTNAHYCDNGSWTRIGDVQTEGAVFEDAMWFNITGRTYNISYSIVVPSNYSTFDSATVNFSLNINDSLADVNHTTFNCSIHVRYNNTAAYTRNKTNIIIYNNTAHNGTTITFTDGDRVWWYWTCDDNYSRRIINLSTYYKIFDIDLVYYTLSLGANKVINLSFNTGEIVTKGGITAENATVNKIQSKDGNITFHNASGSEWMRITDGKFGIGTTFPLSKLDVSQGTTTSTNIDHNDTPTYTGFAWNTTTQLNVSSVTGFPASGTLVIDSEAITYSSVDTTLNLFKGLVRGRLGTSAANHTNSSTVYYLTSSITRNASLAPYMAVRSDGKIGIGTSTPDGVLHVVGNSNTTGNQTLGDKITFRSGEIIDNIVDGRVTITGDVKVTGTINITKNITIATQTTPSSTDICDRGTLTADDNYIYFCNSTANWTRTALSGW